MKPREIANHFPTESLANPYNGTGRSNFSYIDEAGMFPGIGQQTLKMKFSAADFMGLANQAGFSFMVLDVSAPFKATITTTHLPRLSYTQHTQHTQ